MASTYTTRVRLEKQGDGENPNSWGTILNQNVIDLIDDAVAGYTVVSVSSVSIALTTNDGTPDQSRAAALDFSGTLTADVTITLPSVSKTYFVRENTSGSFAVILKTVGGSGLTLTQSQNTFIACNGTEIYQIEDATSVASFTANTFIATSITASVVDIAASLSATDINATNINATTVSTTNIIASVFGTDTQNAYGARYVTDVDPLVTDGSNGDIWYKY